MSAWLKVRSHPCQRCFCVQRQLNGVGVMDIGFMQIDANERAAALLHALAEVAHRRHGAACANLHHQRRRLDTGWPAVAALD